MSKEKTLESAIQEFKNGIKQSDYVKLGAKGEYLTVPYRIKFFREYFGSRGQILTFSSEMANGSSKFRASVFLDGKELSVGESKQMLNRDKEFEKAQTVSVGRALSILGFMGNEIATAEEIEDFIKDKEQPKQIKKEVKKTIPKATQDTKVVANEWIAKLKELRVEEEYNKLKTQIQGRK